MKNTLLAAAAFLSIVGLTANVDAASSWTRRSFDAQNTGNVGDDPAFTFANVKDLQVTQFIATANYVNATPVVVDGMVIIGDWAGHLIIVDVASGRRLVNLAVGGLTGPPSTGLVAELGTYAGVQSTPLVATVTVPDATGSHEEKRLYVGVDHADKTLYCLNLDLIEATPNLDNDPGTQFFCSSPTGNVWPRSLAADGPSGNSTYNGTMVFAKAPSVKDSGGATSTRDVIYTPTTGLDCANGQFWAIDAYTGELLWSFDPVVNGQGKGGTIWTTPAMSRDGSLVYISTGDCVGTPQVGEKAESLVALDATDGHIVWWYQKRLIDTADLDIGTGPLVADVDGPDGCHVVISTDKDGCIYSFNQTADMPQVGDLNFDPIRAQSGEQGLLWRQCFVPGSLNGGFNASNPGLWGRIAAQQTSGYPLGHVGADDANAFGIDVCTGHAVWATSNVKNGRIDAAIASGMLFQASADKSMPDSPGSGYGIVRELEVVRMDTGQLLATLPIQWMGQAIQPTLGGGGPAIVDGKIYIPTIAGIAVAEVVPGSSGAAPVPYGNNLFLGPYPLPIAPGGAGQLPYVNPNDPYPLMLDPTLPKPPFPPPL